MQTAHLIVLSVVLGATPLSAQANPAVKRPLARHTYLSPGLPSLQHRTLQSAGRMASPTLPDLWGSNLTGRNITQVHLTKSGLPNLMAGEWAMTFSTSALMPPYANAAGEGFVVMGKWEPNKPNGNTLPNTTKLGVFTPGTLAVAMNGPGATGLMIEPSKGQFAVVEHNRPAASRPMLSFRLTKNMQFARPVPITGISAVGTSVDPAVALVDGVPNLFWVASGVGTGTDIVRAPIITTPAIPVFGITAAMIGSPIVVVTQTGKAVHSPTPLIDVNGNCQAILCSQVDTVNNDTDYFLQPSIWNKSLIQILVDTRMRNNNSGMAGGVVYVRNTIDVAFLFTEDVCLAFGSRSQVGTGTSTVTVHAKSDPAAPIMTATFYLGVGGAIPAVTIPGIAGQLGMAGPYFPIGNTVSSSSDDVGYWSLSVPNLQSLIGATVTCQALVTDVARAATLTNTFELSFF